MILVTGGGGFLGKAIVKILRHRSQPVRSFSRQRYAELDAWNVEQVPGDLTDPKAVTNALRGCELVYHVAAKAGVWGKYKDYHLANVVGTQNILRACQEQAVPRLVYTSSPSVVHDGRDMENVDESVPYPTHFEAPYPQTKAQAEQAVLAANGPKLATVALRPHLIWGPGDPHLIPRIIARAKAGKLRRIGRKNPLVDTVYVDNAALAHVLAGDRLQIGSAIAGKVYFISQGDPRPLWDFINQILAQAHVPAVTKTIPFALAYRVGAILEGIYRLLPFLGEPPMTRFVAKQLATAHWYNISAAKQDLNYHPSISIEEGLQRLTFEPG